MDVTYNTHMILQISSQNSDPLEALHLHTLYCTPGARLRISETVLVAQTQ